MEYRQQAVLPLRKRLSVEAAVVMEASLIMAVAAVAGSLPERQLLEVVLLLVAPIQGPEVRLVVVMAVAVATMMVVAVAQAAAVAIVVVQADQKTDVPVVAVAHTMEAPAKPILLEAAVETVGF